MNIIKTILISLLFAPLVVVAHAQAELPKPGLTPENPFYFLDTLGESLQEFFTFNPEGKARLHITFAAERIAEIKIMLETKGVEAKGMNVAQSRLQAHLASATLIVKKEKQKGKNVTALAKELDDEFGEKKSALRQSFEEQENILKAKEKELKKDLREARRLGDSARAATLTQELALLKTGKELLDAKKDSVESDLEAEEERLEDELDMRERAEKAMREAREERQEMLDEAAEEGVVLSALVFAEFDSLLSQAQGAFDAGNYEEAKRIAKQAEDVLEDVEDIIEEAEEAMEDEEEGDNNDDDRDEEQDDDGDEDEEEDAD